MSDIFYQILVDEKFLPETVEKELMEWRFKKYYFEGVEFYSLFARPLSFASKIQQYFEETYFIHIDVVDENGLPVTYSKKNMT